MTDTNTLYNIALSLVPDIGPVTSKLLISYCGSAEEVFKASKKQLAKIPQIGPAVISKLADPPPLDKAEEQIAYVEKIGGKVYLFHDDDYPKRLKHFETSPLVLYGRGELDLNPTRTVAIVGTRTPTEEGKLHTQRIVEELNPYGVQVISGLAFGVDSCAHRKSVDVDIPTIGVLGHGIDLIYPASNKLLVKKMMDQRGGVLTQFPIKCRFDRVNFPARNRIIAGMADVVIVVESKSRGGSMITAEFGNEMSKDVFAIPGRVTDEKSEGCNKLIKQHKAHLLESVADIAYIMRWEELDKQKTIQKSLFIDYTPEEERVISAINSNESITVDHLMFQLEMQPSKLASHLLNLEFKGAIKSLPGKKYMVI